MVTKSEREIATAVDLCRPDGRLNPAAVGWSRQPMIRANLKGWGRNKRFEYWCITTPDLIVAVNISHSDYRVTLATFFLDLSTLKNFSVAEIHWLPGKRINLMPEVSGSAAIFGTGDALQISMEPTASGTRLRADCARLKVDIAVEVEPEHESMTVVVPWDEKRFQLTRKDNCQPASGTVVADGQAYTLSKDTAYATLDHGRGRWPYSILWNWASASGRSDGHEIGLQFGAKWTDGTTATENALRIDGRIIKISEDIAWHYDNTDFMKPWSFHGAGVDLTFTPLFDRQSNFNRIIVLSREDQVFGHFNGTIKDEAGATIRVENLLGWAEEVHRRW